MPLYPCGISCNEKLMLKVLTIVPIGNNFNRQFIRIFCLISISYTIQKAFIFGLIQSKLYMRDYWYLHHQSCMGKRFVSFIFVPMRINWFTTAVQLWFDHHILVMVWVSLPSRTEKYGNIYRYNMQQSPIGTMASTHSCAVMNIAEIEHIVPDHVP